MSGQAKDRRSKTDELLEGVPFSDIGDPTTLAAKTPLTREAVIHLRAAAAEVGRTYGKVRSLLSTVDNALVEPLGGPKTLSEERRMDLAELVCLARDIAEKEMMEPVYERGRGERPHGDGPHLSLDEQEVRELIVDLYRIGSAAAKGSDMQWDHSMLRNCMNAIGLKVDRIVRDLEGSAGMALSDVERGAIYDVAAPWGEKAMNLGRDAVESEEEES